MDGQLLISCVVVGLAGAYVLVRWGRAWRSMRSGKNCGGGCGCAKPAAPQQPTLIAPEELKMRR